MATPIIEAACEDLGVGVEVAGPPGSNDDWKRALHNVVPCVLVLKVTQTRAMDTEPAGSSYATGFIVDKARGIILTNRHVVTPGPIVADAIFLNREELPVVPLYFDPVHDFGFLRFDPSKLQFMAVGEVPLVPEAACVGLDIRVVGNDSGEKISILAGTLARLDRDAPNYGRKVYNDFNTFYLQAASGTKGGSSGSPVIDCQGRCIGLNAGGKDKAASAYYLPLERVVRALRLVQASLAVGTPWSEWGGPVIPRGDLQATFTFKGFDDVRRLGLRQESEVRVRAEPVRTHGHSNEATEARATGMLVVESSVPGGPGKDGVLEAGDVLVAVNGKVVTHFLDLEEVLDDSVGKAVHLSLERGSLQMEVDLVVSDLHAVTPSSLLELAGGSVHALSYQQARNNRAEVGQVYVAEPGYMLGRAGVPKCAIITALSGRPTPDLPTFAGVLRTLPHGARAPLEFYTFGQRAKKENTILHVDRQWYGAPVYWTRDDAKGAWHPTTCYPHADAATAAVADAAAAEAAMAAAAAAAAAAPAAPAAVAAAEADAAMTDAVEDAADGLEQAAAGGGDGGFEQHMRSCLALVEVHVPLVALADGVHSRCFGGNGLVVHHGERLGLVVVDRNTVAVGTCDLNISFGAHPAEVTALVRFLHPLHNFAIISYNPADLPAEARASVKAAPLLAQPRLRRGESVHLVGLTKTLRLMQRSSVVTNATSCVHIAAAEVPRFRAVHEEVIKLDHDFGTTFSGALCDSSCNVRALWGSYAEQVEKQEREWCAGLTADVIAPWVDRLVAMEGTAPHMPPPFVCVLDAELEAVLLSKAAQFGLPPDWVSRLDKLDPERRQVMRVRTTVALSDAAAQLQGGDMILAIHGTPITCYADLSAAIATAEKKAGTSAAPPATASAAPAAASSSGKHAREEEEGLDGVATILTGAAPGEGPVGKKARAGDAGGVAAPGASSDAVVAAAAVASAPPSLSLPLTVFRGGRVMEVSVRLGREDGMGTDQVVHWCGAQLQAPHRSVRERGVLPPSAGVFISRWHHGSPAHRYGLFALHFISEVNGVSVPDMPSFLKVVSALGDGDFVRVKMTHLETMQPKVLSLKQDLKYWPTWLVCRDADTATWQRRTISTPIP